jgi:dCMP deaminase
MSSFPSAIVTDTDIDTTMYHPSAKINPRLKLRPTWDQYFTNICEQIKTRSLDPDTQVGCVVVDKQHVIIATGYNSYLAGIDDTTIPFTRPEKYDYTVHAEAGAICMAARRGVSLKGCTIYLPFEPCKHCALLIISAGIIAVKIYGMYIGEGKGVHDFEVSRDLFGRANVPLIRI